MKIKTFKKEDMSMRDTMSKSFKKSWALLVALVCCFSMLTVIEFGSEEAEARISEQDNYLTEAELNQPIQMTDPSGRVTFTIRQVADGKNQDKCLINESNGFNLPETSNRDGVLCLGDTATYNITYNVKDSTTDTVVRMRIPTVYENRNGEPLRSSNGSIITSYDLQGLSTLAQGGTGTLHTGSISNNILTMNFQASTSTATIDLGNFDLPTSSSSSISLDQVVNLRMQFLNASNSVVQQSTGFPNPIRVVGTTMWDPRLKTINKENPAIYKENGTNYYQYSVALRIPRTTLPSNGNVIGAPTGNQSYVLQDAKVSVDVSRFPEGSIIVPSNEYTTLDSANESIVYEKTRITGIDSVRTDNYEIFKVRIPSSALNSTESYYEWNANISGYESSGYSLSSNSSPYIQAEGYMGSQGSQPGMSQGSGFDTRVLYNGQTLSTTGDDYANNDWAAMIYQSTPFGAWGKSIYNDDNGEVGTRKLSDLGSSSAVYGDTPIWVDFSVAPYNGKLVNAMYCDTWDARLQKVDTARTPKTQVRDQDSGWTDVNATILYSTVSPGYNNESINSYSEAAQKADCNNEALNWTEEPTDTSNIVKVVFDGEYDAIVSGSDAVQRAQLPFKPLTNEEYKGWASFPGAKLLSDNLVHSNNNAWDSGRERESYWVRGEHLNMAVKNTTARSQNAGTTQYINGLGNIEFQNYLNNNENVESFDTYPEVEYRFDSGYTSIDIEDFVYENYYVSITNADFGPDNLPGTSDDVSPWIVNLKAKNPITISSSKPTENIVSLGNSWVKGTLPPYASSGKVMPTVISYIPDENIQNLYDIPADNTVSVNTTVNAVASMAQSKWALKSTEFAGNSVGWGVSYSNTSGRSSGETIIYDILPYPGDSNGTTITEPLTNVEFEILQGDSDMRIEVTDVDPSTINNTTIRNGSVPFVSLENQDQLSNEITAFRIIENSVQIDAVRLVRVTADTSAQDAGKDVYNGLLEGTVSGISQPMPSTTPVLTSLVTGTISGNIYYDDDNNGTMDTGEENRYSGVRVDLLDELNNVVDSATSSSDGSYVFNNVEPGNYTVRVGDRGSNLSDLLNETGSNEYEVSIATSSPSASGLNFGYWTDQTSSITVEKRVVGYSEGSSIRSGEVVEFQALVENTGDVAVDNITVVDDVLGTFNCPSTSIAAGDSMVCSISAPYNVTD